MGIIIEQWKRIRDGDGEEFGRSVTLGWKVGQIMFVPRFHIHVTLFLSF